MGGRFHGLASRFTLEMPKTKPKIHILATSLGNNEDLSPRTKNILAQADLIFCEDTRKVQHLFKDLAIESRAPFVAIPGDRERDFSWEKYTDNPKYKNIALVSDAGTPLVNDPGYALISFCHEQDIPVYALPGPSAPTLAWQWSGGFGLPMTFAGFVPKTKSSTNKSLDDFFEQAYFCKTFIFFDTKHQIQNTLEYLTQSSFANQELYIAREMTKPHEELISGTPAKCLLWYEDRIKQAQAIGELTLVLHGIQRNQSAVSLQDLASIRRLPPKSAAKLAASLSGHDVKTCYEAFLNSVESET